MPQLQHVGDEVIHVLEGEVTVTVDGEGPVVICPGDTCAFNVRVAHTWRAGRDGAGFLLAGAPPSF